MSAESSLKTSGAEVASAFEFFKRQLRNHVAKVFEGNVCQFVESHCPDFLVGSEGAVADCGLLLESLDAAPEESNDRRSAALRQFKDRPVLLPLDCKTISPVCYPYKRRRSLLLSRFTFEVQRDQSECFAFIVGSPSAPGLVAVLPYFYFKRSTSSDTKDTGVSSQATYTGDKAYKLEPFPMEWAPFVMPLSMLPRALQELVKFCRGEVDHWKNPYNGIIFRDLPRPDASSLRLLDPSISNKLTDGTFLEKLRCAFRDYSGRYTLEPLHVAPLLGDIQVYQRSSTGGERASLELKRKYASITNNGRTLNCITTLVRGPSQENNRNKRFIFSTLSMVDFFLFELDIPKNQLLLLSRDEIPNDWFTSNKDRVSHHFPEGFLAARTVPHADFLTSSETLASSSRVRALVEKLSARMDTYNPFGSQSPRPFRKPPPLALPEPATYAQSTSKSESEGNSMSKRSMYDFLTREAAWFREQCVRRKCGSLLPLGFHPCGSFMFTPVPEARFYDLHNLTAVVYVNFAAIHHIDLAKSENLARPLDFVPVTQGPSPSIFVLCPSSQLDGNDVAENRYERYVVPSAALTTDSLEERNKTLLKGGSDKRSGSQLEFRDGEVADVYRRQMDDVLDLLLQFCREDTDDFWFGDQLRSRAPGQGHLVKRSDYITNVQGVTRQTMMLWEKESLDEPGRSLVGEHENEEPRAKAQSKPRAKPKFKGRSKQRKSRSEESEGSGSS